jgi:hypothetical protein
LLIQLAKLGDFKNAVGDVRKIAFRDEDKGEKHIITITASRYVFIKEYNMNVALDKAEYDALKVWLAGRAMEVVKSLPEEQLFI